MQLKMKTESRGDLGSPAYFNEKAAVLPELEMTLKMS